MSNILNRVKIVVINLEKHENRKNHMKNVVNKISKIKNSFFKAIDGRNEVRIVRTDNPNFDIILYNNFIYPSNYNYRIDYNFRGKLSHGQIGCCLSHLIVCEELLFDNDHDYYIVLEDDSELNENENILYDYINNLPNEFDMIHLDMSDAYHFEKTNKENDYYYNIQKQFFNRASAMIISKSGAAKYVSYVNNNICRPADDSFSNLFLFKNFKVLIPNEWLFKLSDHSNASTIGY